MTNRHKVCTPDTPGEICAAQHSQHPVWVLVADFSAAMLFVLRHGNAHLQRQNSSCRAQPLQRDEIASRPRYYRFIHCEVIPADLEQVILAEFSDIKSAEVDISLPAMVNVIIEERIPAVLWIEEARPVKLD